MTGAEHYRMAEEILAQVRSNKKLDLRISDSLIATAQVHATLALAVLQGNASTGRHNDPVAWQHG